MKKIIVSLLLFTCMILSTLSVNASSSSTKDNNKLDNIVGSYTGYYLVTEYTKTLNGKLIDEYSPSQVLKELRLIVSKSGDENYLANFYFVNNNEQSDMFSQLEMIVSYDSINDKYLFKGKNWIGNSPIKVISGYDPYGMRYCYTVDLSGKLENNILSGIVLGGKDSKDTGNVCSGEEVGTFQVIKDFNRKYILDKKNINYSSTIDYNIFKSTAENFCGLDSTEIIFGEYEDGTTGIKIILDDKEDDMRIYNYTITIPSLLKINSIIEPLKNIEKSSNPTNFQKQSIGLFNFVVNKIKSELLGPWEFALEAGLIALEPDYLVGDGSFINWLDDNDILGKNTYPYQTLMGSFSGAKGSNIICLTSELSLDEFLQVINEKKMSIYLGFRPEKEVLIQSLGVKGNWHEKACNKTNYNLNFEDKNLEKLIRGKINKPKGDIFKHDIENITKLYGKNLGIKNISGIENLTNLTYLDLQHNQIKNIDSIKHLTNLSYLDLTNNEINNIESLKNLTTLRQLGLANNKLTNIEPLSELVNLKWLFLKGNSSITDYSSTQKYYHNIKNKDFTLEINTNLIGDDPIWTEYARGTKNGKKDIAVGKWANGSLFKVDGTEFKKGIGVKNWRRDELNNCYIAGSIEFDNSELKYTEFVGALGIDDLSGDNKTYVEMQVSTIGTIDDVKYLKMYDLGVSAKGKLTPFNFDIEGCQTIKIIFRSYGDKGGKSYPVIVNPKLISPSEKITNRRFDFIGDNPIWTEYARGTKNGKKDIVVGKWSNGSLFKVNGEEFDKGIGVKNWRWDELNDCYVAGGIEFDNSELKYKEFVGALGFDDLIGENRATVRIDVWACITKSDGKYLEKSYSLKVNTRGELTPFNFDIEGCDNVSITFRSYGKEGAKSYPVIVNPKLK